MNQGQQFWDQSWQGAAERVVPPDVPTFENDIDTRKVEFLGARLPRSGKALEVGCGSARLLCRMGREAPLELFAVDNAPSALELAKATARVFGVEVAPVTGDAFSLPFDAGTFDLVLSGGLLEHFPDPQPVLAEMVRVLKPGGVFYADVVPRRVSWFRWTETLRMLRSDEMSPGVHESDHPSARYERWLTDLGVQAIQVAPAGIYPPFVTRLSTSKRRWLTKTLAHLEKTPFAERLGWYFMVSGIKRRA